MTTTTNQIDPIYEVVDSYGESHKVGTYLECMAFIQEPSQARYEFTTESIKPIEPWM